MKRLLCFALVFMFLIAVTAGASADARTVWYDDEAARAGVTNDSWMSLESDTDIYLNEGREFHIWTQYYGTDAITQEVKSIEILLNGEQYVLYDNFFMDCHIPYDVWKPMLVDGQYVMMTLKFDTVYGPSEQSVPLVYNPDVPPLCEEHTWQVNRQQEIYAPCIVDSTKHYLKEAYYDRVCTVCGLVQRNEHLEYGETFSPVVEAHQCGEDGICVAEGCGAPAMLTGRVTGFGDEPGSSYIRDYNDNGLLEKEYLVVNLGDGSPVFESIKTFEDGVLTNEKKERWNADHTQLLDKEEVIYNGHFSIGKQEVNGFQYRLGWSEASGYSAMCYSNFYPDTTNMLEYFGDEDVLLQTDYHRRVMARLSEEIRTNELFDVDRYNALDEDGKINTLEEITRILEDIFETDYNEVYIHMWNDHDFPGNVHIDGEGMYDTESDNVYLINAGSWPFETLVSKLAHEMRHSVQHDITESDDETLSSKYDLDRDGGDDYEESLGDSFDHYWKEDEEKLTADQRKQIDRMAADIADQLNIPDEYRDAFCEHLIQYNLLTYQYRTQTNELDAWIVEGEVKQMMDNR